MKGIFLFGNITVHVREISKYFMLLLRKYLYPNIHNFSYQASEYRRGFAFS